jgi:diadenosine tetraphosphatase ApaH/serine/threonine PP2A family protein phosphatase
MAQMTLVCLALVAMFVLTEGGEFLKATHRPQNEHVSEEDIRTSLLAEVEGTLGVGSATNRLHLLEAILKPMYTALPKNEHGNLGHSTVRYALHRLFIMRHGWHIKDLGRNTDASNMTSAAGVLKDQVPAYIQNLFEKRLGDKGLGLHELAVMAATMEHLIHKEVVSKLGDVYNLAELLPTQSISETKVNELLDIYMMAFILGENLNNLTFADARTLSKEMPELFVGWQSTQEFVRRIRDNVTSDSQTGKLQQYDFHSVSKVLEVVGEEFGTFQQSDCDELKATMMNMEYRGTGRVKLGDFYKPGLDGNWQFQESVGYLRQLGTLGESDPNDSSVVIVNYFHSFANCIAPSGFYTVCCKDECEGLIGQLEEEVATSEATPAAITTIVENLPSSSVQAPRQLPETLLHRLSEIAAEHGGLVPLHGRLFAQWLHHAYPRECPYPHVSGTTSQQTPDEWAFDSGMEATATAEEMRQFAPSGENATLMNQDLEEPLPWSFEEELLVVRETPHAAKDSEMARLRPLVLLALAGSLAFGLVRSLQSTSMTGDAVGNAKFVV